MMTTIILILIISTLCAMFFICAGFSRRIDELEDARADFEAEHAAMLDARRNFWDAMSGKPTITTNSTTEINDQDS